MKQKNQGFIIPLLIGIVVLLAIGGGAYFYLDKSSNTQNINREDNTVATIVDTITNPDKETNQLEKNNKPIQINPKTYISKTLGITFQYIDSYPEDNTPTSITEKDNTIFINNQPKIVVFNKKPSSTLKEAIEEAFLKNYDSKKCWVKIYENTGLYNYEAAGITFPPPPNENEPWWYNSDDCPIYSETNGVRYFIYDPLHADRFVYFSGGQDTVLLAPKQYENRSFEYTIKIIDAERN